LKPSYPVYNIKMS